MPFPRGTRIQQDIERPGRELRLMFAKLRTQGSIAASPPATSKRLDGQEQPLDARIPAKSTRSRLFYHPCTPQRTRQCTDEACAGQEQIPNLNARKGSINKPVFLKPCLYISWKKQKTRHIHIPQARIAPRSSWAAATCDNIDSRKRSADHCQENKKLVCLAVKQSPHR